MEVAAGIANGGIGRANDDAVDLVGAGELARHAKRRLCGGLREIAGRDRLVVDGHDLALAIRE
ncbi:hypothetical protein [Bradyrhizobium sp. LB13.1]